MNPLEKFTTDQLKVMVYDLSVSQANIVRDLETLNAEIGNREKKEKAVPTEPEKKEGP